MKPFLSIAALASVAAAQTGAWGQCGGSGFSGATTCVSGYTCVLVNQYYSQCQPGAASSAAPTTLKTSVAPTKATSTAIAKTSTSSKSASAVPSSGAGAVRYLGRVNPATKELTWPGTGISFTFTGSSATIGLSSVTGTNSADLIIDGGAPIVISNVAGTSISTPAGLAYGTHTVQLRKRSEALYGSIFLGSVTTDGTLGVDKAPTHQIEIIGDSITVGYGLDGVGPSCTNSAAVEDNPLTYEALAANALNADYNVIAWSGKGVVRNIDDTASPLIPELWTRYGANDADNSYTFPSSWMPQAVVINLGTNDFSYLNTRQPIDPATYQAGIVKFVQTIQTHYPNAQFFLLSSPMLSDSYPTAADAQHTTESNALKAAVVQIGAKAHFVDWPTQGSDVGCDYHPNAATHAAEGKVLAAAISAALGW